MNRTIRLTLVMVILVGLMASFTSPASANSKVTSDWGFSFSEPVFTCQNGKVLMVSEDWATEVTTFLTKNGDWFMQVEQWSYTGYLFLQDVPDKKLYYAPIHWKNMFKPGGQLQSVGIVSKITIPGYGIVFKDIGLVKYVWDPVTGYPVPIFSAGEHQDIIGPPPYAAICAYLTSLP
jgi:hypothetical protein